MSVVARELKTTRDVLERAWQAFFSQAVRIGRERMNGDPAMGRPVFLDMDYVLEIPPPCTMGILALGCCIDSDRWLSIVPGVGRLS